MTHSPRFHLRRRSFLLAAPAALFAAACSDGTGTSAHADTADSLFADDQWRTLTDADWRTRLDPAAFRVLRKEATERPFTSPLNGEKRAGTYHCAGCDLALFESSSKYESGTGWPSFSDVKNGAVGTKADNKLWTQRTEYHCARCAGHQGHIFEDGPAPTGLRYCNNGVALTFKTA